MSDDAMPAAEDESVEEGLLDRVPEWVVPLGAGFLLAATLVSLVGALFGWYSVVVGRSYGYPPYALVLLALEFTFVTIIHAAATRWARRRVKWMWVMLASILGLFLFVTIPLNAFALLCLGLGKRHFSSHTPAKDVMRSLGEEAESTDESGNGEGDVSDGGNERDGDGGNERVGDGGNERDAG